MPAPSIAAIWQWVAAGVGGARLGIGVRMAGGSDGIQLAEDGHGGPGPAGVEECLHARQGEAVAMGHPQLVEDPSDEPGGLDLPVPELRVLENGAGQPEELVPARVHG